MEWPEHWTGPRTCPISHSWIQVLVCDCAPLRGHGPHHPVRSSLPANPSKPDAA